MYTHENPPSLIPNREIAAQLNRDPQKDLLEVEKFEKEIGSSTADLIETRLTLYKKPTYRKPVALIDALKEMGACVREQDLFNVEWDENDHLVIFPGDIVLYMGALHLAKIFCVDWTPCEDYDNHGEEKVFAWVTMGRNGVPLAEYHNGHKWVKTPVLEYLRMIEDEQRAERQRIENAKPWGNKFCHKTGQQLIRDGKIVAYRQCDKPRNVGAKFDKIALMFPVAPGGAGMIEYAQAYKI